MLQSNLSVKLSVIINAISLTIKEIYRTKIFTSYCRPCGSCTGVEIKVEGCAAKKRYLNSTDTT